MATIHIDEIRNWLLEMGRHDGLSKDGNPKIEFLEIRFDDPQMRDKYVVDEEMVDETLSVEAYFGSGVIQFDERGCIKSIDFT